MKAWKRLEEKDQVRFALGVNCTHCKAKRGESCVGPNKKDKPGPPVPPHADRRDLGYVRAHSAASGAAASTLSTLAYALSLWKPGDTATDIVRRIHANPQPRSPELTEAEIHAKRVEVAKRLVKEVEVERLARIARRRG